MKIDHLYVSEDCQHGAHPSCHDECSYCGAQCLCVCHIAGGIEAINQKLSRLLLEEKKEMANIQDVQTRIDKLQADVTAQTTVTQSAVTLIAGIKQQLTDVQKQLADAVAANDPAAIQAASDALDALTTGLEENTKELGDAVAAGTPSQP